ncbi:hypothetical protein K2173_002466 [Erythroxylum novogranatense]|uniref:Uncharacterized protein n=1 Tax=Erythroxylum novogranatense TaxID=1862640 RepID=A0AAV8TBM1_9ROSI|nr:hypothetical protein K2173_002466 [Erythroxylum novogranatense]
MSRAEHMGVSPSKLDCHTNNYPCPKQTVMEQTHGLDSESKYNARCEQDDQCEKELVQTGPGDSIAIPGHVASEPLGSSVKDVYKITEVLDPLLEHTSRKSTAPRSSSMDFGGECAHSDPLKENGLVSSEIIANVGKETNGTPSSSIVTEKLQAFPVDSLYAFTEVVAQPHEDSNESNQVGVKNLLHQETTCFPAPEFPLNSNCCDTLQARKNVDSEMVQKKIEEPRASPICVPNESLDQTPTSISSSQFLGLPPDNQTLIPVAELLGSVQSDVDNHLSVKQFETPKNAVNNSSRLGGKVKKTPKFSRKKYMLRSLTGTDRVLRSRSQGKLKAPETSNSLASSNSNAEKKNQRRKKRIKERVVADEYSRIKTHLRYLLNRMNYEQSLIIAYSGEGWKGLSLEKLKPEKELQRATAEILKRKLKIRDLFHRIDSLCAEGRFPTSLFDSDGQISSEDIFCARCGSKDLTMDNDIVLCDGICDRGFHQLCLTPPLLKEDIPPDDEGWLCPGCDCKVDCIDMLNDSQGTDLSVMDSWEKVFPEAAIGQNLDQNFGLSSDDSDDNDFDPDVPEIYVKREGDESNSDSHIDKNREENETSSDESDFTSASDELPSPHKDDQYVGLPSDDPDDDDFDPDAPDRDEKVEEESSSSDFTSDSEDLSAALNDNELAGEEKNMFALKKDYSAPRSRIGRKESLKGELMSILEQNANQECSESVSQKRNVERLDYKKLYDETYANASSDSSDDEDYADGVRPMKRRRSAKENTSASANGIASMNMNGSSNLQQYMGEIGNTNEGERCHKVNLDHAITSPAKIYGGSSASGCHEKNVRSSSYKRLGDAVTQTLYNSFKENQYPDRATKERLANDLGITFQQVDKWFGNARWSYKHSSWVEPTQGTPAAKSREPNTKKASPEAGHEARNNGGQGEGSSKYNATAAESYGGVAIGSKLDNQKTSKLNYNPPKTRGRKRKSDDQKLDPDVGGSQPSNPPKTGETQTQVGERTTRGRKSVS